MAYIRMFDFEIKHIPGSKNQAADALSRKPVTQEDIEECDAEDDLDDWIDAQLSSFRLCPVRLDDKLGQDGGRDPQFQPGAGISMPDEEGLTDQLVLAPNYSKESQMIATFLTDGMKRPSHMSPKAWRTFRKNALNYVV